VNGVARSTKSRITFYETINPNFLTRYNRTGLDLFSHLITKSSTTPIVSARRVAPNLSVHMLCSRLPPLPLPSPPLPSAVPSARTNYGRLASFFLTVRNAGLTWGCLRRKQKEKSCLFRPREPFIGFEEHSEKWMPVFCSLSLIILIL